MQLLASFSEVTHCYVLIMFLLCYAHGRRALNDTAMRPSVCLSVRRAGFIVDSPGYIGVIDCPGEKTPDRAPE